VHPCCISASSFPRILRTQTHYDYFAVVLFASPIRGGWGVFRVFSYLLPARAIIRSNPTASITLQWVPSPLSLCGKKEGRSLALHQHRLSDFRDCQCGKRPISRCRAHLLFSSLPARRARLVSRLARMCAELPMRARDLFTSYCSEHHDLDVSEMSVEGS
jgi:hypothetical protein